MYFLKSNRVDNSLISDLNLFHAVNLKILRVLKVTISLYFMNIVSLCKKANMFKGFSPPNRDFRMFF